jgi:hypothetical protein
MKACKVCSKRKVLTTHHFHWSKARIIKAFPNQFNYLRSVKQKVCAKCHKAYHNFCVKNCIGRIRDCYDCQWAVICCYYIPRR